MLESSYAPAVLLASSQPEVPHKSESELHEGDRPQDYSTSHRNSEILS